MKTVDSGTTCLVVYFVSGDRRQDSLEQCNQRYHLLMVGFESSSDNPIASGGRRARRREILVILLYDDDGS